jgi:ABC-type uncharacterized transport system substrate-binding protein
MWRRHSIFALVALVGGPWTVRGNGGQPRPGSAVVTVVATTAIEAHRAAIEGIREALAKVSLEIRVVDLTESGRSQPPANRLAVPGTRVIIAVGTDALRLVASERPEVPVISTMVLRNKAGGEEASVSSPAAIVALDVPLPVLLARLKQAFPDKKRLGIIRNPATGVSNAAAIEARAERLGFTVRVVESSGAEHLLEALVALKGQVDFVWCLPDSTLYNSATIKPLILASIENRLPLIGFSESFARAGAALGVYPDFQDIGVQTGEVAQQIIAGQPVRQLEGPRKLKMAVNQSVLRLLGLRYSASPGGGEVAILP